MTSGYFSPGQVAEALGLHERTVRRWVIAGKIQHHKSPGGRWMIPARVVEEILAARIAKPAGAADKPGAPKRNIFEKDDEGRELLPIAET